VASISVIADDQDPTYPFKMTTYQKPDKAIEGSLFVYRSTDGLHWEAIPGPRFEMGDRNAFMSQRSRRQVCGLSPQGPHVQDAGRPLDLPDREAPIFWISLSRNWR